MLAAASAEPIAFVPAAASLHSAPEAHSGLSLTRGRLVVGSRRAGAKLLAAVFREEVAQCQEKSP
jgi:hypothetical protein